MWWLENKTRIVTVQDMYDYYVLHESDLLHFLPSKETVDQDFWDFYDGDLEEVVDKYFVRKFKRFWYYDQDTASEYNTTLNVYNHFYDDVLNFLLLNAKRYNELYRIYILSDSDISPINDFHITEEREGQTETDRTFTSGSRSDSGSDTRGTGTDTTENQQMAFNSADYIKGTKTTFVQGARTDSYSATKGQQIDTDDINQSGSSTTVTSGRKDNAIKNVSQYDKYWGRYVYIDKIFQDINKEILLI